ncbi:MAG: hypothetical protein JST93_20385 [Acidobacteria bacterium]|nr:hypothetical protein [Acidobacteriota bacterium]
MFRAFLPQSPAVERFRESMQIDYWKWHDGIGYDIELLKQANADERRQMEALILARGARDWRDVEALAALRTPKAIEELRQALHRGDHDIAMAVIEHAPDLVTDAERTVALVSAIAGAEIGSGLAEALRLIKHFHPPEVIDALFRAVLTRPHQALLVPVLTRICGPAKFRELCETAGVEADQFLRTR